MNWHRPSNVAGRIAAVFKDKTSFLEMAYDSSCALE